MQLWLCYVLFALSGACALGYEIVWTRQFGLGLGHELPGILAVVAAFFGGISIGALALDARISRSERPGLWYVGLESAIGIWVLATVVLMPTVNDVTIALVGLQANSIRHWLAAFTIPFLFLLPATMAMGATFPAMERFLAKSGATRSVGGLYAANTIGAVFGTVATTFFVAPLLGFRQTLIGLALTTLTGAIAVYVLARTIGRFGAEGIHSDADIPRRIIPRRAVLMTAFATGLLGIGFEVLGIRLLAEVLENTIYTFATALSVYLIGTAFGAALFQRLANNWTAEPLLLGLLVGTSTACLASAWPLANAQRIYDWARSFLPEDAFGVLLSEMLISALVFGPATVFMGATLSLLAQAVRRSDGGVGLALASNTFGGAVAPVLFGVLVLPAMGSKALLIMLALTYLLLAVGWAMSGHFRPAARRWKSIWVIASGSPLLLSLLLPSKLHAVRAPEGGQLLEYRPGVMDSVAVVKHFDGHRSLLVNNRFIMGGTGAAGAARRHAHIPLLLHPAPGRALFLGLGTGITFAAAGAYPGLAADGVELVPDVIRINAHFSPENAIRPGMKIHLADARRFVRTGSENYDVIVADLFHPARDGAGSLYTVEHFRAIQNRLAPNGLFCQWLPLFQMDEPMLRTVVASVLNVFPNTRAYLLRFNIDTPVLGLIATLQPVQYPTNWLGLRVHDDELRQQLKTLAMVDEFQLFGCLLADSDALRTFSAGATLNLDDRPIVTFEAPQFTYRRNETSYGRLLRLLDQMSVDAGSIIQHDESTASREFVSRLNDFIKARDLYLHALVAEDQGKTEETIRLLVESVRASSDFTTSYAHCLTIAVREWVRNPAKARALLVQLTEAQPSRTVAKQLLLKLEATAP